ncbi:hypothetical protein DP113_34140 (plasmid) [Brasilonema octagenarum UFV-E1]|uniref:Uncharacterized protein n=2 Tax=Brasilonema TaxID=383614 RepID=A0A856MPT6_9CYAN|nr:hypothetical protein [Brasilonema octagenarum UFV-OR1]QDL12768.1 hypothetical protein DP114_34030 [Brasilonema sennae CENA114]QDL19164.1 hypothetical protein DP113_34140 [Brasilonema octagenarum UFV-E1]
MGERKTIKTVATRLAIRDFQGINYSKKTSNRIIKRMIIIMKNRKEVAEGNLFSISSTHKKSAHLSLIESEKM